MFRSSSVRSTLAYPTVRKTETAAIIEAKRGWVLPGGSQLERYANRVSFRTSIAPVKKILTLSECSQLYATAHSRLKAAGVIPVEHIAWSDIIDDARLAERHAGHTEKRLLRDLVGYLELVMTGQRKDSNLVYVVSLANRREDRWETSWIEVVTKYSKYFHPVGKRWPKDPPNYIAFRYAGQLQSIHHINEYEVIDNLGRACPGIPDTSVDPHYLYTLGPAIVPQHVVKNGAVWPNGRCWCVIDALLTSATVSEARDQTNARGITG